MDQNRIIEILNRHIFNQEKDALIRAVARNPERFVGQFRSSTPRLKLMQNLLQSREIRFGDALEEVITLLITEIGFTHLDKRLITEDKDDLSCDQYFCSPDHRRFYLVEQKIRDDHDSTKKRGQFENFRKKLIHLESIHHNSLIGIMYFIDPSLRKNEGYYIQELEALRNETKVSVYLFYNGEFFEFLEGHTDTWDMLLQSLTTWRHSVPEQLTLDYDLYPEKTLIELRSISPSIWYKLIANDDLWVSGVITALFPSGETLRQLENVFRQMLSAKFRIGREYLSYTQIADLLSQKIDRYYPR